jgi:hypothetical protein
MFRKIFALQFRRVNSPQTREVKMPSGNKVRPLKWSSVLDLFDDGGYSAIWGYYDNSNKRVLGVRWNGQGLGFPNQAGNPIWYVENDFLAKPILQELFYKVLKDNSIGNLANIQQALSEV